eukprot:4967876-Karenia_brevis.AAC.1
MSEPLAKRGLILSSPKDRGKSMVQMLATIGPYTSIPLLLQLPLMRQRLALRCELGLAIGANYLQQMLMASRHSCLSTLTHRL